MCHEEYLKIKIKSYDAKINTNFYGNKIPKEGVYCACVSIILLESLFKIDKHYYIQKLSANML